MCQQTSKPPSYSSHTEEAQGPTAFQSALLGKKNYFKCVNVLYALLMDEGYSGRLQIIVYTAAPYREPSGSLVQIVGMDIKVQILGFIPDALPDTTLPFYSSLGLACYCSRIPGLILLSGQCGFLFGPLVLPTLENC